ncbi:zinc finger, C3HC4 type (RING finger) protein [Gregarina niphandrodes]|uniref:Zinc finger, C3HC4 type (RING finger) protein n=1 Tax=Gregarina niphandrodes TaxID=110365 RepID=A0A023B2X4_GRENI|nr:zinc finger, C3HC4 type (RING finger) protein [Gregarina niphandrodes]EZG55205.1 zinc finger, C3HC4 type (RING finger) protein [Gregarina niphandrodes]|eukprot:XP_011131732.1 zinc finger, C3HC4 type (RING finger) protein [Gregarina niphandrodes]
MDDGDLSMFPCPCDYQVCLWCLKRIQDENNKCPLCRRDYDESAFRKIPRPKKLENKNRTGGGGTAIGGGGTTIGGGSSANDLVPMGHLSHHAAGVPVVCRLYFCPPHLLNPSLLAEFRYMAKYGRLISICISTYKNIDTAFVLYADDEAAQLALCDINKAASTDQGGRDLDRGEQGRSKKDIRLHIGAARHCLFTLKGTTCPNEGCCPFIHVQRHSKTFWKPRSDEPTIDRTDMPHIRRLILNPNVGSFFGKTYKEVLTEIGALRNAGSNAGGVGNTDRMANDKSDRGAAGEETREGDSHEGGGGDQGFTVRRGWDTRAPAAVTDTLRRDDPLFPALDAVAPIPATATATVTAEPPAKPPVKKNKTARAAESKFVNPFQDIHRKPDSTERQPRSLSRSTGGDQAPTDIRGSETRGATGVLEPGGKDGAGAGRLRDATQEVVRDAAKEVAKEVSKEVVKEVSKEVAKEAFSAPAFSREGNTREGNAIEGNARQAFPRETFSRDEQDLRGTATESSAFRDRRQKFDLDAQHSLYYEKMREPYRLYGHPQQDKYAYGDLMKKDPRQGVAYNTSYKDNLHKDHSMYRDLQGRILQDLQGRDPPGKAYEEPTAYRESLFKDSMGEVKSLYRKSARKDGDLKTDPFPRGEFVFIPPPPAACFGEPILQHLSRTKLDAVQTGGDGVLPGAPPGFSGPPPGLSPPPGIAGPSIGTAGLGTSSGLVTAPPLGTATGLGSPGSASPGLGAPGLGAPGLGVPGLGAPGLGAPTAPPGMGASKMVDEGDMNGVLNGSGDLFGWDTYEEPGTQWLDGLLNLHLGKTQQPSFVSSTDFEWNRPSPDQIVARLLAPQRNLPPPGRPGASQAPVANNAWHCNPPP